MKDRNNASAIIFLVTIWLVVLLLMGNSVYKTAVEFTGPKFKLQGLEELLDGRP